MLSNSQVKPQNYDPVLSKFYEYFGIIIPHPLQNGEENTVLKGYSNNIPLLTKNVRPKQEANLQKFQIWKSRRLQSQVATNRKTVFVNIITIALQLAYETETLNKNNVKKHIYQKTQNFLKNEKTQGRCFNSVRKIQKNISTKTHQIFSGVCNTPHTLLKTRFFNRSFKKVKKCIDPGLQPKNRNWINYNKRNVISPQKVGRNN